MPEVSLPEWDDFLSTQPNAHLLQTGAWGELKADFGWQTARLVASAVVDGAEMRIGAQVLFRRLPLGWRFAYIPKGPVGGEAKGWAAWKNLWIEVDALCRLKNVAFLKIEPDRWEQANAPDGKPGDDVLTSPQGFRRGQQSIQPLRTLLVDLHGEESQILERMKPKTRYNIRLALKKGIVVSTSSDLATFYRLLTLTGRRDDFGVHSLEYYQRVYELFYPRGECALLLAEYQGEPIASLMVFAHGNRAWYFYGASSDRHRERMPAYLLQWEAMRWARARGCLCYDLWGVTDEEEQVLEANFTRHSQGLWGVYRFKRGFGGQLYRASGPWDRVYRPGLYQLYHLLLRVRSAAGRVGAT